jgi:hypothetical protein
VLHPAAYDVTVFKLHWGRLPLKIYEKGETRERGVLRIEVIANRVMSPIRCLRRII